MAVVVDIADRMYDYTDEEKAAEAVADFQALHLLTDETVVAIWSSKTDPRRVELEKIIFDAVDANGSAKRAMETVPADISLLLGNEAA
jgi:hypothetical protein